jgi:hypothetical protein
VCVCVCVCHRVCVCALCHGVCVCVCECMCVHCAGASRRTLTYFSSLIQAGAGACADERVRGRRAKREKREQGAAVEQAHIFKSSNVLWCLLELSMCTLSTSLSTSLCTLSTSLCHLTSFTLVRTLHLIYTCKNTIANLPRTAVTFCMLLQG